jgi:hypothetical protein
MEVWSIRTNGHCRKDGQSQPDVSKKHKLETMERIDQAMFIGDREPQSFHLEPASYLSETIVGIEELNAPITSTNPMRGEWMMCSETERRRKGQVLRLDECLS